MTRHPCFLVWNIFPSSPLHAVLDAQVVTQLFFVATVVYGPALALEIATGIDVRWLFLIIPAVGILYAAFGGDYSHVEKTHLYFSLSVQYIFASLKQS